jgi:hypothetical protein
MTTTVNYKGDLLSFVLKCGCKATPTEIFETNKSPAIACEVRVNLTQGGEEKILCAYSEGCDTICKAEESAIRYWRELNPELCPPLNSESIKDEFLNHLTVQVASQNIFFRNIPQIFVCTIRVPLGNEHFLMRSKPCNGKKEAEANAAKNWLETHKSAYEISSQLKGLSSSSHLRSLIHDWCCWCCRMWSD